MTVELFDRHMTVAYFFIVLRIAGSRRFTGGVMSDFDA
jgi:hypothetical protein